jgi:DNA-binding CsgD family transcriptional regulator
MVKALHRTVSLRGKSPAPAMLRNERPVQLKKHVFDYIERIETISDRDGVAAELEDRLEPFGIECFSFVRLCATAGAFGRSIVAARLNDDWLKLLIERGYAENNPLLCGITGGEAPVFWSDMAAKPDMPESFRAFFLAGAPFGIAEGITIPLHRPGSDAAVASFFGTGLRKTPETAVALQIIAIFTYRRLLAISGEDKTSLPVLTPREKECLSLAALGKSDRDIAANLHIGERTVHGYVEGAKRKMGAATRIQAVVSAIREGAIDV